MDYTSSGFYKQIGQCINFFKNIWNFNTQKKLRTIKLTVKDIKEHIGLI